MFIFDRQNIKAIYRQIREDANIKDPQGETILMKAAKELNLELFNYALQHNADINAVDMYGHNVLSKIITNFNWLPSNDSQRKSWIEATRDLIRNGIDTKILSVYEESLFLLACRYKCDIGLLELLVNHDNINLKDVYQHTPLYMLCKYHNTKTVQWFLTKYKRFIDMECRPIDQTTALNIACYVDMDLVKILLDNGAIPALDTNMVDHYFFRGITFINNYNRRYKLYYLYKYFRDTVRNTTKDYNVLTIIRKYIIY